MKRSIILMTLLIIPSLMIAPALAQTVTQTQTQAQDQQTQTPSPESAAAPDKTPVTVEKQQAPEAPKTIEQKIQDLQRQVENLKEQGRTREKLTITTEETAEKEKDVLTAVGREYTLMQKGKIEAEYSFRYEYVSSSEIIAASQVQPRANHTIRNAIGVQYGLLNNLTVNANVPFVFIYDKTGSSSAKETTDLGDVTLGLDFQPFKVSTKWPTTIFTLAAIIPTGRSPYKINRETDLPTGNGTYAINLGMNMSKSIDPAMAFGGIGMTYRFKPQELDQNMGGSVLDRVEPGMSFNAALGLAYSISYALSMNVQVQYAYNTGTDYYFQNTEAPYVTPAYSTASLIIGTGWRFSPKMMVSLSLGIGLTSNDPDFFFLVRLPFSF